METSFYADPVIEGEDITLDIIKISIICNKLKIPLYSKEVTENKRSKLDSFTVLEIQKDFLY